MTTREMKFTMFAISGAPMFETGWIPFDMDRLLREAKVCGWNHRDFRVEFREVRDPRFAAVADPDE